MADSYLKRTPSSAGNRKTFTMSTWIKRSKLSYNYNMFYTAGTYNSTQMSQLYFANDDKLRFGSWESNGNNNHYLETPRRFRDVSAWYHIVVAVDTTQATASNRVKIYINGVQETLNTSYNYPAQNHDYAFNSTLVHNIGRREDLATSYHEGYLSHVVMVDGTALAPTVFGETDSTSGIWKFKSPSGVTFGTNGFHLKFESSGNLGLDSSGNTNNFTVGGDLKQTLDTPSNSYSTLNELARVNNYDQRYVEHINGNTTCQGTSTSNNGNSYSTLGVDSGKWYCEVKVNGVYNSIYPTIGYISETNTNDSSYSQIGYTATGTGGYKPDGEKIIGGSGSSYGDSFTAGDIIGVALDMDNGAIYFSKNGTFQDSGNPASGASKTGAAFTFTPDGNFHFFGASPYRSNSSLSFNFGGGNFGTTAIASAGSNGNGSLFEYDVPTGYYALNTKNINTYG